MEIGGVGQASTLVPTQGTQTTAPAPSSDDADRQDAVAPTQETSSGGSDGGGTESKTGSTVDLTV